MDWGNLHHNKCIVIFVVLKYLVTKHNFIKFRCSHGAGIGRLYCF